MTDKLIILMY